MKSRGIKFALGLLALTLGGLAVSSHAQQPKVKFAFKDITVPTAVETNAFGINNKKEIVGDYINQAGAQEALFLKGSKLTKVACPSGGSPALYGVNSGGSAVSDDYCGNGVVWTYVPGVGMRPVPNPGCPDCPFFSLAINDIEVVAGMFQNEQQQLQGFTLDTDSGEFTAWDLPGGPKPQPALGMNNAGTIVLSATDPASGLAHSYLFDGKSFTQIDVPGALQSFAHGINNNGDISGFATLGDGSTVGFLMTNGSFQTISFPSLNALSSNPASGDILTTRSSRSAISSTSHVISWDTRSHSPCGLTGGLPVARNLVIQLLPSIAFSQ